MPRTAAPITSPRPVPAPPAPPAPPCDSCGTPVPHANSFCGKCGATNPNHTPTLPIQTGSVAPRPDRVGTIALIDDSGAESTQFPLVLGENRIGPALRRTFGGVYIANEGFTKETAEQVINSGEADAVAFGKLIIANPDLPKRFAVFRVRRVRSFSPRIAINIVLNSS